ncbi:MAG: gliding motility-associated C-terminal domain-containing protein, partial [Bacteroidota bacterium]
LFWEGLTSDDCSNCTNPTVTPLLTSNYRIAIIDANGCTASDELTVQVEKERAVFIPNVFSPNGDGQNDVFQIFADPTIRQVNVFKVFNRWGAEVFSDRNFQPNDPTHSWDGRLRGEQLNPAVFVYFAEIEFLDGIKMIFKGDVTLVR